MALYKATVSFSGLISMSGGKVGEISDPAIADDLLKAGYIIPYVADKKAKEETAEVKPKTAKRKAKKDD